MGEYLQHVQRMITTVDEFDFAERIKPSAIMCYFQDMASAHAEKIGIGFDKMKENNLYWVLNRLTAEIDRMPLLGEEIIIATYPHTPGIADAIRDYYITDNNDNCLIRGTSRWCVLDMANKAIRKVKPLFDFDDTAFKPEYAVENGNPKLPAVNALDGNVEWHSSGKVRITDLDRNIHMNNARYADIVINTCDFDFYSKHTVKAFDFNFLSEMKVGDAYEVSAKTIGNRTNFEATNSDRTKTIFRAAIKWE